MAKKRKSIATTLDEVDRTIYASFCTAANSLSQLHMHALNHQKLSFQAGTHVSELLGTQVKIDDDCIGVEVENLVAQITEGNVVGKLMNMVRFVRTDCKNWKLIGWQ